MKSIRCNASNHFGLTKIESVLESNLYRKANSIAGGHNTPLCETRLTRVV